MMIDLALPADTGSTEGASAPLPENGEAFAAVVEGVVARQGQTLDGTAGAAGGDRASTSGPSQPTEAPGEATAAPDAGTEVSPEAAAVAAASVIAALMGVTQAEQAPVEALTTPVEGIDAAGELAAAVAADTDLALGSAADAQVEGAGLPSALLDAEAVNAVAAEAEGVALDVADGEIAAPSVGEGAVDADSEGVEASRSLVADAGDAGSESATVASRNLTARPAAEATDEAAPAEVDAATIEADAAERAAAPVTARADQAAAAAAADAATADVQPTAAAAHQPRVAPPVAETASPVPHVVDVPEVTDPNVARIGGAIRSLGDGERHQLTLGLTPEHLGRVTVDVVTGSDGGVHLHLRVDRPEGAAALNNATHGLRADLEAGGLRLDRVEVSIGQGSANGRGHGSGTHHEASDLPRFTRPAAEPRTPEPVPAQTIRRPLRADGLDLSL